MKCATVFNFRIKSICHCIYILVLCQKWVCKTLQILLYKKFSFVTNKKSSTAVISNIIRHEEKKSIANV